MLLVTKQVGEDSYKLYDTSENAIGYGTQYKDYSLSELEELSNSGVYIGGYSRGRVRVHSSLHEFFQKQKAVYKIANSPLANFDFDISTECEVTMYYNGASSSHMDIDRLVLPRFVESVDFRLTDYRTMRIGSLVLNEGLRHICDSCFYEVDSLESVVIPDSVDCIDSDAFRGVISLKSLVVGSGVTYIASNAFRACSLKEVVFKESNNELFIGSHAFAYNSCLRKLVLDREVCDIAGTAFTQSSFYLPVDMQRYLERKCTFQ